MKITFCGAAKRVTGSNFLIESKGIKFLVDCGLFQGDEKATRENWADFCYDSKQIDFVLLTHSHIDHIGRLPLLRKRGFQGKIYATKPTCAFSQIFLEDTCHILTDTAKDLGLPVLFTLDDLTKTMELFETLDYYQEINPAPGIKVKFYDAGHILGSSIIEIQMEGKIIIFSGDLGNPPTPILRDTDFIPKADYVVMETTYGDRMHEPFSERSLKLERTIEETQSRNGVLLIPSFAMERTQEIIYELNELIENKRISKIPIYIDSPLAIKATEIYKSFPNYFDFEAQELIKRGKDFFKFPLLKYVENTEESKALDQDPSPKIIIAGSGMSNGGRILFHERRYLPEASTTLLVIGFQVKGTLGRALESQEKKVTILGSEIAVRAQVTSIESYSAHADQQRLKYWLSKIARPIKKVFLVHGEPPAQDEFLHRIQDEQGLETYIPNFNETVEL